MVTFARLQSIRSHRSYVLDQPEFTLGRIVDCDIYIDSHLLSRQHAKIWVEDTVIKLQDLGSTNGTFVNSMRISSPVVLQHGDVITLGDEKLVFIAADPVDDPLLADNSSDPDLDHYSNNHTMVRSHSFEERSWPFLARPEASQLSQVAEPPVVARLNPQAVPALLIVRSGRRKGTAIELRAPRGVDQFWSIGRSSLCDVVLDDPTVSSDHASIRMVGGQWFVADNDSTNGVRLNGARINEAECQHGDLLIVGSVQLQLHLL